MLTTAVAQAIGPDGKEHRLVGSSRRTLNPAQRAALGPGEIPVSGAGHAEMTVLNAARTKGLAVMVVTSTRPTCEACRKALEAAGAKAIEHAQNAH